MFERTATRRLCEPSSPPPIGRPLPIAEGPQGRVEALAKLKSLFEAGVLTTQQFADERARLLDG